MDLSINRNVIDAANLLLAADGRFPAGGYAHSSGLEQAIERGRVKDESSLREFLAGNLSTVGRNAACFAAAACNVWMVPETKRERNVLLADLGAEESARIPSPWLREASRAQARQFLRAAGGTWPELGLPSAALVPSGIHLSMAQGIVGAELGLGSRGSALLSTYSALTGPAAAAVKLLGLDPFAVNRVVARLGELVAEIVDEAGDLAGCEFFELPAHAAPLLETGSALHAVRQPRMFAS